MDALASQDGRCLRRTAKPCGPDAPTLASSFAGSNSCEATVAKEPGHRGERVISRKPLRREGRIVSANLWRLRSCASFCVRGYGCLLSTRLSLRPLTFEGHLSCNSSGALTPRECEVVPRHCEERSDEAIQSCRPGCISGLLRFSRNDGSLKFGSIRQLPRPDLLLAPGEMHRAGAARRVRADF